MEGKARLMPMKEVLDWLHIKAAEAQIKTLQKITHPTIRAMVKRGEFPEPIRLTPKIVCWNTKELEEWWNDKIGN